MKEKKTLGMWLLVLLTTSSAILGLPVFKYSWLVIVALGLIGFIALIPVAVALDRIMTVHPGDENSSPRSRNN